MKFSCTKQWENCDVSCCKTGTGRTRGVLELYEVHLIFQAGCLCSAGLNSQFSFLWITFFSQFSYNWFFILVFVNFPCPFPHYLIDFHLFCKITKVNTAILLLNPPPPFFFSHPASLVSSWLYFMLCRLSDPSHFLHLQPQSVHFLQRESESQMSCVFLCLMCFLLLSLIKAILSKFCCCCLL